MKALVFRNNKLGIQPDFPEPAAGANEALIRVLLAGICATDLEIVKGYMGFEGIPGHEFVGVVEKCADKNWLGKRVVGSINIACRQCTPCFQQGPEHCPERSVLGIFQRNGAFARYLTLPTVNLHKVPDAVADNNAVFTEPLAAALRIADQVAIRPTAKTAVVGPGRLGLLIGQVLSLNGTRVTMFGRSESSLALAEELGLRTRPVNRAGDDEFDFVVEATGNPEGFTSSLRIVRPRGTIILKSTFAGNGAIDLTKVVVGEINLVGSRCGPFAPALRLLASGKIKTAPLVEEIYPLERGLTAFEHAARPGAGKVLLRPE